MRRGRMVRLSVGALAAVTMAAAAWSLSGDALAGEPVTVSVDLPVGETAVVGWAGAFSEPVRLRTGRAHTTRGLDVRLAICHPATNADPIGAVHHDTLDDHCADLEPAQGGELRLSDARGQSQPYLVALITRTDTGPQALCGVDLSYRYGLRVGWHRDLPWQVAVTDGDDTAEVVRQRCT